MSQFNIESPLITVDAKATGWGQLDLDGGGMYLSLRWEALNSEQNVRKAQLFIINENTAFYQFDNFSGETVTVHVYATVESEENPEIGPLTNQGSGPLKD